MLAFMWAKSTNVPYELDLESSFSPPDDWTSIQVSKSAKECYYDYRDAKRQNSHAQHRGQQLRLNIEQLDQLSPSQKERIRPAQESLNDVEAALPTISHLTRKRDRWKWVMGRKAEFEREIAENSRIESSAAFGLLISLSQDMEKIRLKSADQYEELKSSLLNPTVVYTSRLVCSSYIKEPRLAQVRRWDWLSKYLGIKSGVILSKAKDSSTMNIFARWPLELPFGLSQVMTLQILLQNRFPSLPKLALRPQSIIPSDSEAIEACEKGNISRIRELLMTKRAHPNDRTPDDLTVFRYAVRAGNAAVVQLLLDHGADPNLPFGSFETSPMNNAFFVGNVEVIRLLLDVGADLDYVNSRTWTSVSFLWDPYRSAHMSTSEILDICVSQGFSAWNDTDPEGWTPCHRAAAFGRGEDIRNLHYKGGNMESYTTEFMWGPITCAVWFKNESTFDALMDLLPLEEVLNIRDSRGWTLLHMAAKSGSRHILTRLLDIGVDPKALTVGTQYWVTARLEYKHLPAETIAREYGHGELWDELLDRKRGPG